MDGGTVRVYPVLGKQGGCRLRISAYIELLEKSLPKGRRILAKGPPGVGKTFAVQTACRHLGMDLISLCVPLQSPVKIGGYPRPPSVEGGDATHCLFDGIAAAFRATKPTCLFWDDLGMGNGETLKAVLEMIQFGRIDGRTLPDCVVQTAATNDVGHGADVQGLLEPLKTRFHSIISVEPHLDDTVAYGLAKGWPSWYLAWLRNTPDALHDWQPTKSISIDGATPRGHEYCAEWDLMGVQDLEVWSGCIGKGRATQAMAFRQLQNELPDVDSILVDPEGAIVPENPSARFLVCMALASRMTALNFGQALCYLNRMPAMFRAFSIRDALRAEAHRRADNLLPKGWVPFSSAKAVEFSKWACSKDGQEVVQAAA